MSTISGIPEKISLFCHRLSEMLSGMSDQKAMIDCVRNEFSGFLVQKEAFTDILRNIVEGAEYPGSRTATMFDNELLLYADPNRLYSLRLFLWSPNEYTQIHDHSSWGVIGPVSGEFEVIEYRRDDDGARAEYASLSERERLRLQPGETAFTLPLNEGIHKVGNPMDETLVSLSLYGNPLPRGYINAFDAASGRVHRIVSQRVRKKLLAAEALPAFDERIAHEALEKICNHPLELIRTTSRTALEKLK
jgi:predicted metal-dependent enzyme (double-stranded beta helix superfamily)